MTTGRHTREQKGEAADSAALPVRRSVRDSLRASVCGLLFSSNAKQAASYYILRFGFEYVACKNTLRHAHGRRRRTLRTQRSYGALVVCMCDRRRRLDRGLETGHRDCATHVIRQNKIIFALSSPLNPVETEMGRSGRLTQIRSDQASAARWDPKAPAHLLCVCLLCVLFSHIMLKGDFAKDVAFGVKDCRALYAKAMERGAVSVKAPVEESDEHGRVITATVRTYGDVVHTFVQRDGYKGVFLPGYKAVSKVDPLSALLPTPNLHFIDHIVGNQPDLQMVDACNWYEKVLDFHRFWSVDDSQMHSEYSALRSIVMTDYDEKIKMPINEPAPGKRKSQIQEFVDYRQ